nr:unnamed protein product [Callosobruchus chinensis]
MDANRGYCHKAKKVSCKQVKYLRRIKGCTREDRIRSEYIRIELQIPPLLDFIEHKQLRWWGHLHRMKENIPVKRIWEAKPERGDEADQRRLGTQ